MIDAGESESLTSSSYTIATSVDYRPAFTEGYIVWNSSTAVFNTETKFFVEKSREFEAFSCELLAHSVLGLKSENFDIWFEFVICHFCDRTIWFLTF